MPSSFLLPVSLEYRYDSWSSILEHEDVSQSQGCQSSKLSSESWAIVEPSYQSQPSTSEFFFFFFFGCIFSMWNFSGGEWMLPTAVPRPQQWQHQIKGTPTSEFLFFKAAPVAYQIPRLGIKLDLQLWAYTTATTMPDQSCNFDLCQQLVATPDL